MCLYVCVCAVCVWLFSFSITSWWLQLMKSLQREEEVGWEGWVFCLFLSQDGGGVLKWLPGLTVAPGPLADSGRLSGPSGRLASRPGSSSVSWHALAQQSGWGMTNQWKRSRQGQAEEHLRLWEEEGGVRLSDGTEMKTDETNTDTNRKRLSLIPFKWSF